MDILIPSERMDFTASKQSVQLSSFATTLWVLGFVTNLTLTLNMALLQTFTAFQSLSTLTKIPSFTTPKPTSSFTQSALITHHQSSLFSSNVDTPFSLSTLPRKLLCKPPQGKHVREDYLVVCVSSYRLPIFLNRFNSFSVAPYGVLFYCMNYGIK